MKTNLAASRIRLLFVSDAIPPELRRIIEFLNKNMDPAEVLGLELRQFQGPGLRTMVPLVVGQTQEAVQRRNPTSRSVRNWDEDSFFAELGTRASEVELQAARRVVNWMKEKADRIWFGKGQRSGSIGGEFTRPEGSSFYPILLWTYGRIEFQFQLMKGKPYFDAMDHRRDLMHRLNGISGVSITEADLDKRPAIALRSITSDVSLKRLVSILDWVVDVYKSSN